MAAVPRSHHYVTKAYLDGFVEGGSERLYAYGRMRGKPFYPLTTKVAKIRDYHSIVLDGGTIDVSLEHQIGRQFEGPGIPVIQKLARGDMRITRQQRMALASFIALQSLRVPFEREFLDRQNKQGLLDYIRDMDERADSSGEPVDETHTFNSLGREPKPSDWVVIRRQDVEEALREVEADPRAYSRDIMLALAPTLTKIYFRMDWVVYLASGSNNFITSDCPVVKSFRNGQGLGKGIRNSDCEIAFPLGSKALLFMRHSRWFVDRVKKRSSDKARRESQSLAKLQLMNADDALVQKLNEAHAKQAYLWAFSATRQDWLLDQMQQPSKNAKGKRLVSDSVEDLLTSGVVRRKEYLIEPELSPIT